MESIFISLEEKTSSCCSLADPTLNDFAKNCSPFSLTEKVKSPQSNGQVRSSTSSSRLTSQKKKLNRRKSPPLNWFPRQKVASYLQRKIQMLQEGDGMNSTLDETLGEANLHYSKVLREKIAAREAATKAMEARKSAMIEASWCRILQAARIQSKEAEAIREIAENAATEAFEAALTMGVIIYDKQNFPKKQFQADTSTVDGGASTTHAITASFETAFEVDKEVTAAVKAAILRLAKYHSSGKGLKNLLLTFSANPNSVVDDETVEHSCATDGEPQIQLVQQNDDVDDNKVDKLPIKKLRLNKSGKRKSLEKLNKIKLVNTMLQRLEVLKDEELCALATIVATCGLSAALAEVEGDKLSLHDSLCTIGASGVIQRRKSSSSTGANDSHLPSLDNFLVKHISKLEREVQQAKNAKNVVQCEAGKSSHHIDAKCAAMDDHGSDLGSILVKHRSKLEREIKEANKNADKEYGNRCSRGGKTIRDSSESAPGLESILVKHVSKLEKEVQKAKIIAARNSDLNLEDANANQMQIEEPLAVKSVPDEKECQMEKENFDSNRVRNLNEIGKVVVKKGKNSDEEDEGLDKVLVKHISRLEKEKMRARLTVDQLETKISDPTCRKPSNEGALDQILVKPKSKLERVKSQAEDQESNFLNPVKSRREARERELQEQWGGLGLGSFRPHLSKLEREKAAWVKAEEEEKRASRLK